MGTVCRTGIPGLFVDTAEKVLRQVDCSVLTVKRRVCDAVALIEINWFANEERIVENTKCWRRAAG